MVIEEFRVELDNEEKELLSNPEKWFLKLPLQKFTPFVDALENWSKCHVEGRCAFRGCRHCATLLQYYKNPTLDFDTVTRHSIGARSVI